MPPPLLQKRGGLFSNLPTYLSPLVPLEGLRLSYQTLTREVSPVIPSSLNKGRQIIINHPGKTPSF